MHVPFQENQAAFSSNVSEIKHGQDARNDLSVLTFLDGTPNELERHQQIIMNPVATEGDSPRGGNSSKLLDSITEEFSGNGADTLRTPQVAANQDRLASEGNSPMGRGTKLLDSIAEENEERKSPAVDASPQVRDSPSRLAPSPGPEQAASRDVNGRLLKRDNDEVYMRVDRQSSTIRFTSSGINQKQRMTQKTLQYIQNQKMQGKGIMSPSASPGKRLDTYEFLETNGSAIVSDLPQKEVAVIEKLLTRLLREEVTEDTTLPVSVALQVMEATGRKKNEEDAEQI